MDKLAERLAGGEREAFAELYDACADRLYHYLLTRLGSQDAASDVLQETFVRLARSRQRLKNVQNPVAYAFAVARNEAARYAGRIAGRTDFVELRAEHLFYEAECGEAELRETAQQIAGALARLGPDEREVVQLKIYAGLTFREIAEVTDSPQGTVATRYRTALGRLKTWLTKEVL
jgi:RNA polymerase sigma-70 factor (ECF subfamily)